MKRLLLRVLILAPVLAFSALVGAFGQSFGWVRLSEVWGEHPRFQQFDPSTRRFSTGPSSPVPYEATMRQKQRLIQEIAGYEQQKLAEKTRLEAAMRGTAEQKKQAEAEYWRNTRALDQAIAEKRSQVDALAAALEFGGMTSEVTVLPEIGRVNAAIQQAIQRVAAQRGCSLVFNEPVPLPKSGEPAVIQNFWRAALAQPDMQQGRGSLYLWLRQREDAIVQLGGSLNLLRPVIVGGIDLTNDVVKELRGSGTAGGGK